MGRNFNYYDDYDEYESSNDYIRKSQKKKKRALDNDRRKDRDKRNRQNDDWEFLDDELPEINWPEEAEKVDPPTIQESVTCVTEENSPLIVASSTSPEVPEVPKDVIDPNVHVIKGNSINFKRVVNMVKVENEHNGKLTFGIKFIFAGSNETKEFSRIAWFNINLPERDRLFNIEQDFWRSLQK